MSIIPMWQGHCLLIPVRARRRPIKLCWIFRILVNMGRDWEILCWDYKGNFGVLGMEIYGF
jgi:hypothetical protein